jgi:hypothetical protein
MLDMSVSRLASALSSCFNRVDREASILLLSALDLSVAVLKPASNSSASSVAYTESESATRDNFL